MLTYPSDPQIRLVHEKKSENVTIIQTNMDSSSIASCQ